MEGIVSDTWDVPVEHVHVCCVDVVVDVVVVVVLRSHCEISLLSVIGMRGVIRKKACVGRVGRN